MPRNIETDIEEAATNASQPLFLIGICSRGRQTLLERLLQSLAVQVGVDDQKIEIVIVDNNDTPQIDSHHCSRLAGRPCHVRHQPHAGLVFARNTLFDTCEELGAVWMIGIDDDEWVATDWLAEWLRAIAQEESQILVGCAELIHEPGGSIFKTRKQHPAPIQGKQARILGTCNYAISQHLFSRASGLGMRFNPLFNEIGGEDTELMLRAKRQHNVVPLGWPYSRAFEERSGPRATVSSSLGRILQNRINGFTISRLHHEMGIMKGERSFPIIVLRRTNRSIVYGLGRFLLGVAKLPLGPRRFGIEFGRAIEHFVQAFAIVPYLTGWRRRGYGAKATEPN